MKFPERKDAEWYTVVSRKQSPMIHSFMAHLLTRKEHYQKLLGIDYELTRWLYLDDEIYYDMKEVVKAKELALAFNDPALYWKWSRLCQEKGEAATKKTKELAQNLEGKTGKELLDIMMTYLEMLGEFTVFLMIPLSVELMLQERITAFLEEKNAEEHLPILIFPEKENLNSLEQKDFLKLVEASRAGTLTDDKVREHIDAYGAMSVRYGIGEVWTVDDVKQRIEAFTDDPKVLYEKLEEQVSRNAKKTQEVLDELDAPEEIRELVKLIKEYVFLRTYRSFILSNSYVYARPIFEKIAEEKGLTYQELNFCAYHEVLEDTIPSKEVLAERKKGFGAIAIKPKMIIVTGKDIKEMRQFYKVTTDTEGITQLEGQNAYAGVIRGKVKVVRSNEELKKVEKGDILIAGMTTPDFIPAMERAAAFVTNEGGILCHAAIVSREMKKPCIIGTKIATKVFKDGDLVEVDAEKGIVRKI